MRVLLVEHDRDVREAVRRELALAGWDVDGAGDGEQALEAVARAMPDAVVLDLGLPRRDGLEVCRRLRRLGDEVPILMLVAGERLADCAAGFEAGADDYLVKPFGAGALPARLRALLRRRAQERDGPPSLRYGELQLDPDRHGVRVGDRLQALTRTEYQLLELLMHNPRTILPHSVIYDRVWGYDLAATSNALRVYVGYLRRKLQRAGARELIHTVRGVGYVLRDP